MTHPSLARIHDSPNKFLRDRSRMHEKIIDRQLKTVKYGRF